MATTGVPNQLYQGTDAPDLVGGAFANHTHEVTENIWNPSVVNSTCYADLDIVKVTSASCMLSAFKSNLFRPNGYFELATSVPVCDRLWFEFVLNDNALYNYLNTNYPNNISMFPVALCNPGAVAAFSASHSSGYCAVSLSSSDQMVMVHAYLGPVPKALDNPLISF